jgi:peptidoglycan/xylan/chitin deacetylase (PgdA/CDA1 family)
MYERPAYLKLQAVRAQIEEAEHEIIHAVEGFKSEKGQSIDLRNKLAMTTRINDFSEISPLHQLAMENLMGHLKIRNQNKIKIKKNPSKLDIEKEISFLNSSNQYQVFDKNIEHLSYMLESNLRDVSQKFYPSSLKAGNITGNEFPAKVWSLTFDDGPKNDTSSQILKLLKTNNLKATFFQLTSQVVANQEMAQKIKDGGMEIASHSYSHKQLTKVGAAGLEKEITVAVKELNKTQGVEIKFFRLPYGAGVNSPSIREKIAANGLIHVFWNVDTLDWMAQSPDKIVSRTIALMKKTHRDAGVLLFHDIHQRTADAMPQIMDYLKQDRRRVCTLNEIVTQMNQGSNKVCP